MPEAIASNVIQNTDVVIPSGVEGSQSLSLKNRSGRDASTAVGMTGVISSAVEGSLVEKLPFMSFRPHRLVSSRAESRDLGQPPRDASAAVGMTEKLAVGMTENSLVAMTSAPSLGRD